jgi:hypothetical protein
MANLDNALRRIKRQLRGPMISVPQKDGPPRTFPQKDLAAAYLISLRRLSGEDVDHPLCKAVRNSSAPHWANGIYAEEVAEDPPEDLSEPVGGEG